MLYGSQQISFTLTDIGDNPMSTTALPKYINDKLRGEMTPELQAQHHSRISKRELAKEFDGLVEEMELDKMQLHLNCGHSAPEVVSAHEAALTAFAEHAMSKAVDALSAALISPCVIKACALAKQAYGVYGNDPIAGPVALLILLRGFTVPHSRKQPFSG